MSDFLTGAGAPFAYDYMNVAASSYAPSTIHMSDNRLAGFFRKYLLQKAISRFEFTFPESWDKDYTLYTLYCWGFFCIANYPKFGVIPQGCTLRGYDVFYRPTTAIVSNPVIGAPKELRIGKDCVLVKLQPDYGSVMDLVCYYADMMALTASTAQVNILNSKLSYVFGAQNKTMAESFKRMFDNIASGEPAVVIDKNLFNDDGSVAWDTFTQNLNENYITPALLDDLQKLEYEFDTRIGIPNANTQKRERLISDEVNANNEEVRSMAQLWLEEIEAAFKKARAMFNLKPSELSVKWRDLGTKTQEVDNDITE